VTERNWERIGIMAFDFMMAMPMKSLDFHYPKIENYMYANCQTYADALLPKGRLR